LSWVLPKGDSIPLMKALSAKSSARRSFLKGVGALGAGFWADQTLEALPQNTNTSSKPSDLKITDLRVAVVARAPMTCPLIRIDTNQGIYGLGEVRDGASKNYALVLKSRLLGENPCNVDKVFRKIKQFGGPARQGGGVSGVEMALWDLAGKAYNVPVYQMLGGKFRDKIRCYADTTESNDPKVYGQRLKARKDQGFTWLKMDLGVDLVADKPGAVTRPEGVPLAGTEKLQHMFTGIEITPKGVELMSDYVAQVREQVGMEVPLSADHFGHIGVNSCIRLGKALEKHNLAWLEDMIPWQYTDLLKKISDAVDIPILTGEDIYLKEPFLELCRNHAVDIIHPDLATAGGILETKKIGDSAQELGVPMAMHFAGSPVSCFASVHCAAATENFLVLENHSVDVPWWSDLVDGVEKPIVNHGYITVPDKPGLGITLNEEAVRQHLHPQEPGYFEPTPQWNTDRSNDRLWS
jgi:L-alanine-DL-glutamate epimerase-like enolase superfamily enzyme